MCSAHSEADFPLPLQRRNQELLFVRQKLGRIKKVLQASLLWTSYVPSLICWCMFFLVVLMMMRYLLHVDLSTWKAVLWSCSWCFWRENEIGPRLARTYHHVRWWCGHVRLMDDLLVHWLVVNLINSRQKELLDKLIMLLVIGYNVFRYPSREFRAARKESLCRNIDVHIRSRRSPSAGFLGRTEGWSPNSLAFVVEHIRTLYVVGVFCWCMM